MEIKLGRLQYFTHPQNQKTFWELKSEMAAREDPVIIHYTLDKPWYTYNRYTHPFSNSFVKYQMQTEWKDEPLWEIRSKYVQVRKRIAITLRRLGILPELQPNGCEYINIKPID